MFRDRGEAGRKLADELASLSVEDVIVLAIPRGGVPVAKEVAERLGAPLDLVITRKIGAPGNPELAVGAVTQDGETVLDAGLVKMLDITDEYLKRESARQAEEIRNRLRKYRGDKAYPRWTGRRRS